MSEDDKRDATRHPILFPMKYDMESSNDSEQGIAISRNISQKGILMASAKELVVGASVTITFHPTEKYPHPRKLEGCIVRVSENEEDPSGLWPYMIAVEFDSTDKDLEPLLREVAEEQKGWA